MCKCNNWCNSNARSWITLKTARIYPPKCESPGWFSESSSTVPPTAVTGFLNTLKDECVLHGKGTPLWLLQVNLCGPKWKLLRWTLKTVCDPLFSNQIMGKIKKWIKMYLPPKEQKNQWESKWPWTKHPSEKYKPLPALTVRRRTAAAAAWLMLTHGSNGDEFELFEPNVHESYLHTQVNLWSTSEH